MMDECQRDKLIFSLFVRMNIVLAARRAAIKKKDVRMPLFAARTALAKVCVCVHPQPCRITTPYKPKSFTQSCRFFSQKKYEGSPLLFTRRRHLWCFHSQVLVCSLAPLMHGDHLLDHAPDNHEPCNQIHTLVLFTTCISFALLIEIKFYILYFLQIGGIVFVFWSFSYSLQYCKLILISTC